MEITNANSGSVPSSLGWLLRRPGVVFALLWGFAEGTLFFVLPDVELSLVALYRPRRAATHMAAIVFGAVFAGAVMFTWSGHGGGARRAVVRVPAVTPSMFARAQQDLHDHGVWGTSLGPVRGIPYKVYAVEAPAHCGLWRFLLVTIPARLWRLVVVWLGFAGAGRVLRGLHRESWAPILHAVFWIVMYAIYWATVK